MTTTPADLAAPLAIAGGIVAAGASVGSLPWIGLLGTLLAALALYRAGSVHAWKETAEGRAERISDLERELAEMRAELAIPERLEGIISLMAATADRQDTNATKRLELAMDRVDERWAKHDAAAELRTQRLERAHEVTHGDLQELARITKGER